MHMQAFAAWIWYDLHTAKEREWKLSIKAWDENACA
jgi:hypothetical protein